MIQKAKRTYNSGARREKAQQSRVRILRAAQHLFETQGFDKTTIGQMAEHANVSMPTIYALFKSKQGVLRAIMDECFSEEDHAALVAKAAAVESPEQQLAIAAQLARQIYDAETKQSSLLQGLSVVSPELKQLEREKEQRRYGRLADAMDRLYDAGVIDKSITRDKALDVFWAFTGRDMYRLMVIERGWFSKDYEQWLAQTLCRSLISASGAANKE